MLQNVSTDLKRQEIEEFIAKAKDKVDAVKARLEDEAEKKARRQQVAAGIEATPEPIVYDYHGEWRKECKELLIEQLRFSAF